MWHYARSIAVVLTLSLLPAARGNGLSSRSRLSFFYDPASEVCVIYAVPRIVIAPLCGPATAPMLAPERPSAAAPSTTTQQPFATPTAAPPSATPPPLVEPVPATKPSATPADRPPAVSESTSYFDTYAVVPRTGSRPAGDRCTVGFWNLSDRDVTVKVDGQSHTVFRGKSLPLEVGREFVWQIEGRDPQKEQIATGESALEIVIRR